MVLEPLVLESREELEEKIPQWKATLERLDSPESEKRHLRELLTYAIVEKFSKLERGDREENTAMESHSGEVGFNIFRELLKKS